MTENEIRDAIVKMNNSEEYLALRKYYAEESLIKIIHASREEYVHSNFIAWLLNPSSHHELDYYPLQKLLQMLSVVAEKENNQEAQFPGKPEKEFVYKFLLGDFELSESCEVQTEVYGGSVEGFEKKARIDILIHLSFKGSDKILPIIIENKVLSTENDEGTKTDGEKGKQTEKYFAWAQKKYQDRTKYEEPILIFLAPDFEKDIACKCQAFLKVSYQNLVDYLIEPCLMNTSNTQAKFFIENYLRCLSNSTINNVTNEKEGVIMALTGKEKELLEKFHKKNKDLFDAVLTMLENDEDLPPEDRERIRQVRNVSNTRDYSQYMFEGTLYGKGKLVLAVVKKHVSNNAGITFEQLENAFPAALQGSYGVVREKSYVDEKKLDSTRYYAKPEEVISLKSGDVLVSREWGASNFPKFLEQAQELGYTIELVQ